MDPIINLIWIIAAIAILVLLWGVWLILIKPHRSSGPVPGHVWVPGRFDRKGIRAGYALRRHLNRLLEQSER